MFYLFSSPSFLLFQSTVCMLVIYSVFLCRKRHFLGKDSQLSTEKCSLCAGCVVTGCMLLMFYSVAISE